MKIRDRAVEVMEKAVGIGRTIWSRRKAGVMTALVLIAVGPLLRGAGFEGFAANLVGIGVAALVVLQMSRNGRRRRRVRNR